MKHWWSIYLQFDNGRQSLHSTQPSRLCLNRCGSDSRHHKLLVISKQYKPVWYVQVWIYDQLAKDEDGRAYNICDTLAGTYQLLNANVCPCIVVLEGSVSYVPFPPKLNLSLHYIVYVCSECRLDHFTHSNSANSTCISSISAH